MTCNTGDAFLPQSYELPGAERAKFTDVLPERAPEVPGENATQVYGVHAHLPCNRFQRPIILKGVIKVFQQRVHPGGTIRRSLDPDIRITADEIEQKRLSDQSGVVIAKREFAMKCNGKART